MSQCSKSPFSKLIPAIWWDSYRETGIFDRPAPLWLSHYSIDVGVNLGLT